jgi:hypothetical protein
MPEIKESIENAIRYLSDHPDEARYTDSQARGRPSATPCVSTWKVPEVSAS